MKTCSKCGRKLSLSNYNKRARSKDGLQTYCKDCNRERSRKYYRENTEKHRRTISKRSKRIRRNILLFVKDVKTMNPCPICGENEPCCLDFHHVDSKAKKANIANIVRLGWSIDRLAEEISKCVCMCSNCHRKIHAGIIKCPKETVTLP